MSNSKDTDQSSSHDDEYQYPSSEGVSDYDISEDQTDETLEIQDPAQSRMQQLVQSIQGIWANMSIRGRRGVLVSCVLLVVVVLLASITSYEKKKEQAQNQALATQQKADAALALQKIKQNQAQTQVLNKQIEKLQSSLQSATQSNRYLRQEVQKLRDAASSQNNAQADALKLKIKSLNEQIAKLEAQIKQMKSPSKQQSTSKGQAVSLKAHYQLSAIVDGRAWVLSDTGRTVSVSVGDKLADFGTVAVINVSDQYVESKDGQRIEFGLNVQ